MRLKLVLPVLALLALLVPSALGAAPPSHKKPKKPAEKYTIFGSCDSSKPYKPSRHCSYDEATTIRATFVFESHVGKKPVKTCFRLYGPKPVGGGHSCVKLAPLAYKAYPFKVSGVRQRFSVKIVWYVKSKGGGYKQAGASFMKVTP